MTRFENLPPREYRDQSLENSYSACSSRDLMEIAISGVTGLAVGAALMYLFDPETGEDRRGRLADTASSALGATSGALSSAAMGAGEYVTDIKDRLTGGHTWSDVADDYRGRLGSTFQTARKAVAPYVGAKATRGYLSGLRGSARSGYRGASRSASRYMPHVHWGDEGHGISGTTATVGVVGALALGCVAMYLMDPRTGAGRRSYLMQKAGRLIRDTGQLARATGRHLANKSYGASHRARGMMSAEQVDDRTLEQRIRSQLGHFGNVSDLTVTVNGGCAVLKGRCGSSDVENLVAAAQSVRGVQRVVCEMQTDSFSASAPQSNLGSTQSPTAL
jgi:hypothetical protein